MRVIALLLCVALLSGCATTLKHPDTGTQIECRTIFRFHESDILLVPLLPILLPVYFIIGAPFWADGPIKDYKDCVNDAEAHGFVEKRVEE